MTDIPDHGPFAQGDNGTLRCYNMLWRKYCGENARKVDGKQGIDAMIARIPEIKDMGFNTIWLQPIVDLGNITKRKLDNESFRNSMVDGSLAGHSNDFARFLIAKEKTDSGLVEAFVQAFEIKEDISAENIDNLSAEIVNVVNNDFGKNFQSFIEDVKIRAGLDYTIKKPNTYYLPYETDDNRKRSFYAMGYPFRINPELGVASGNYTLEDKFVSYEAQSEEGLDTYQNLAGKAYSQQGEEISPEAAFELDKAKIREFTDAARANGIMPMFDIAFSHVAADSPLIREHPNWFHGVHGVNDDGSIEKDDKYFNNGFPNEKMIWDDIVKFNYDDPNIRKEIIDTLWKPYIDAYVEMGFTGLRIDSIAQNNADLLDEVLQYFREKVAEAGLGVSADQVYILGETLGQPTEAYNKTSQLNGTYSSVHWAPTTNFPYLDSAQQTGKLTNLGDFWKNNGNENWLRGERADHTRIIARGSQWSINGVQDENQWMNDNLRNRHFTDSYIQNASKVPIHDFWVDNRQLTKNFGGVVGYPGSVDEPSLPLYFLMAAANRELNSDSIDWLKKNASAIAASAKVEKGNLIAKVDGKDISTPIEPIISSMKERMAQSAFLQGGGWFCFDGDEKLEVDNRSVFDSFKGGESLFDLTSFVKEINQTLQKMPVNQPDSWAARTVESVPPQYVAIHAHQGSGYHNKADYLQIDTSPDAKKSITHFQQENRHTPLTTVKIFHTEVLAAFTPPERQ